jgi:rubrerythrin
MKNELKNTATLLKHAIQGEIEGYTFYDLLSKQTDNPDARRRLENLRNDEKRHWNTLTEMFKKRVGGEIGNLPNEGITVLAQVLYKGKLKNLQSEMEYINLALEAEIATTRFYQESARQVDDADFKDILNRLADEENSHYEILMAEKSALSGNYYWFSTGDTSPMED